MRVIVLLALFVILALPISYALLEEAEALKTRNLLRDALRVQDQVSYEARIKVSRHLPPNKSIVARVKAVSVKGKRAGELIELIRDGKPQKPPRTGWYFRGLPATHYAWFKDHDLMFRNYTFALHGTDQVAGRTTDVLDVYSKYVKRRTYRFWIDRDSKLFLRRQVISADGQVRYAIELESVTFNDSLTIPEPPKGHRDHHKHWQQQPFYRVKVLEPTAHVLASLPFKPLDVPRLRHGFVRKHMTVIEVNLNYPITLRLTAINATYTDGIETVNVIQIDRQDLAMIEKVLKEFRVEGLWHVLSRGRVSRDVFKSGAVARLERDDVAVLAAGSIAPEELRVLLTGYLD